MQLFTRKPVDLLACCVCYCSAYFSIPNVSQTSFIAVLNASEFVQLPTLRPLLLIFSTSSHENKVNLFQPISILESIAQYLYQIRNHYIFLCKSVTSHNTIRASSSQTFPPSRVSSGEGFGYAQAKIHSNCNMACIITTFARRNKFASKRPRF